MTVIRTTNNRTFGGYASVGWASAAAYTNDNASWLFSLDQRLKFPVINGKPHHLYFHPGYGPTFGSGHDLCTCRGDSRALACTQRPLIPTRCVIAAPLQM